MWNWLYYVLILCSIVKRISSLKPHIIFILADDLGWNDVGFHGSNQIPTPNIDALAYTGIILNNYYVTPICTPSRSALLTGKYPIRTGLQHGTIGGNAPYGLDLNETILPQYLKRKGYTTRAVGKWHLGFFKKTYTPEFRGFDSHYGIWTGHHDYYDHTAVEDHMRGYDMRRSTNVSTHDFGQYTTDLLTNESIKVIKNHDTSKPLFLYLAHIAPHSANGYSPLEAPNETISKFNNITNKNRRLFAAMVSKLDESVGSVVSALSEAGMLNNSIIIFSTDNGGPADGFDLNAASNWPLRGVKDTLWEGGVKGAGFIWSPFLPSSKVSDSLIHITDWMPTLLSLANNTYSLSNIDGVNVWESLSHGTSSSREEILLNIDPIRDTSALRYKNWKFIKENASYWGGWYGPSGRNSSYNWDELFNSVTAKAIKKIKQLPNKSQIEALRTSSEIVCKLKTFSNNTVDDIYLFDLQEDPCEQKNLASIYPKIVQKMEKKMKEYTQKMVKPRNKPRDPRGNPKYWGYVWTNWMDYA